MEAVIEFITELVFGLSVELPVETAMESKRVKTWVKTLLFLIVGSLIDVILILAIRMDWIEQRDPVAVIILSVIALGWTVFTVCAAVYGHRCGWVQTISKSEYRTPYTPQEVTDNVPDIDTTIRTATMEDLDQIAQVEAVCFPAEKAATREEFEDRLKHYADHFWLLFDGGRLVSFVDGFVTDQPDLTDEMFANASLHDPNGAWQMIFGVNTLPEYRCRGYAGMLLERAVSDARSQGRKGLVLTCRPEKVAYYSKFGFRNEGISKYSTHGGAVWHQMRLEF